MCPINLPARSNSQMWMLQLFCSTKKGLAEKPPVAALLPAVAPEQRWRTTVELVIPCSCAV